MQDAEWCDSLKPYAERHGRGHGKGWLHDQDFRTERRSRRRAHCRPNDIDRSRDCVPARSLAAHQVARRVRKGRGICSSARVTMICRRCTSARATGRAPVSTRILIWNWGVAFCSKASDAGLNRAHITWLEHALLKRAQEAKRSHLDNGNVLLMKVPSRSSRAACRSSACVFITIGPYQATGSRSGFPETSRNRIPSSLA